jgi:hypothetical protein
LSTQVPIPNPTSRMKRKRRKSLFTRATHRHQAQPQVVMSPTTKKRHQRKMVKVNYSRMSFSYSHIPSNTTTPLLSTSLEKSSHFDDEDYSWWSHSMRGNLYSLHPNIWHVVEVGMGVLDSDDEEYSPTEAEQMNSTQESRR